MLLLRSDHPHFARYQAFAAQNGLTVQPVNGPPLNSESRHALASFAPRLLLAGSAQDCSAWLGFWLQQPEGTRAHTVVCLGPDLDQKALFDAWKQPVSARTLVELDHNLAAGPEIALQIVWGAAIPLFESEDAGGRGGLFSRAKGAVASLRAAGKDWTRDAAAWTLIGSETRASKAGFVRSWETGLPFVLRSLVGDGQGLWSGSAQGLQTSDWHAVFETQHDVIQLSGEGPLDINGHRRRMSAMDVLYLRKLPPVPVGFAGFTLT